MASSVALLDQFHFEHGRTVLSSYMAPFLGILVYLSSVGVLSRRPGKPVTMRPVEKAHNAFLIAVSLITCIGVCEAAFRRARSEGWLELVCSSRSPENLWDGRLGTWTYVFYLTKYYELFDTILLALKKKRLLPLHVYHHAVMLFVGFSWFTLPWLEGAWWCAFINSLIHIAMYTYYFLASTGRRVWWKKHLTTAQIVQFMTGNLFVGCFYFLKLTRGCGGSSYGAGFSLMVNLSFLTLFLLFYRSTYSKSDKTDKLEKSEILEKLE